MNEHMTKISAAPSGFRAASQQELEQIEGGFSIWGAIKQVGKALVGVVQAVRNIGKPIT
jgi:hypothetical protein